MKYLTLSKHARRLAGACVATALLGALFMPTQFTRAQSSDDLRELISDLLEQVAELQEQLNDRRGGDRGGSCPMISAYLTVGERGNDVAELQTYLHGTGDYTYPEITGYFGLATRAAVERFQEREGIALSGSPSTTGYGAVGPQTRAALADCDDASGDDEDEDEEEDTDGVEGELNVESISGLKVEVEGEVEMDAESERCNRIVFGVIEWDDGEETVINGDGCDSSRSFEVTHTYDEKGEYMITLEDSSGDELDDESVDVPDGSEGRCYDDGDYLPEGTETSSYTDEDGLTHDIIDGVFVCDDGEWETNYNGGSEISANSCYDDGMYRKEGTQVDLYIDENGDEHTVMDAHYVCDDGEWEIQYVDPVPKGSCYDDGVYRKEGTRVDFYIDESGNEHSISDAQYVCDDGEWDVRW